MFAGKARICYHRSALGYSIRSSAAGIVYPPTLLIQALRNDEKMTAINKALDECSAEHPIFYEDEVDTHLNSKIGADWQFRGQQNAW